MTFGRPIQLIKRMVGLRGHHGITMIDHEFDDTLQAMDAPEVIPAGSHERRDSVFFPGMEFLVETTIIRGAQS